jgi:hypothetical protein
MTNATAVFLPVTDVRATAMAGDLVHQVETIFTTVSAKFSDPASVLEYLANRVTVKDGCFVPNLDAAGIQSAGFNVVQGPRYDVGHLVSMVFGLCDAATEVGRHQAKGELPTTVSFDTVFQHALNLVAQKQAA